MALAAELHPVKVPVFPGCQFVGLLFGVWQEQGNRTPIPVDSQRAGYHTSIGLAVSTESFVCA